MKLLTGNLLGKKKYIEALVSVSKHGAMEIHLEVNYDLLVKAWVFAFKNEVMFQPMSGEQGTHFR